MRHGDRSPRALSPVQRWTSKRRAALVPSILKGETSVQEAARKHGFAVAEIEDWEERFLLAATRCNESVEKGSKSVSSAARLIAQQP